MLAVVAWAVRMTLVMIVDDNDLVREVLEEMLIEEGYDVLAVSTGQQAISEYWALKPDVIVTDILMPGLSGIELIQYLRREAPALPILVISGGGATDQNLFQQATKAGASATLTKPFDLTSFAKILSELLEAS